MCKRFSITGTISGHQAVDLSTDSLLVAEQTALALAVLPGAQRIEVWRGSERLRVAVTYDNGKRATLRDPFLRVTRDESGGTFVSLDGLR